VLEGVVDEARRSRSGAVASRAAPDTLVILEVRGENFALVWVPGARTALSQRERQISSLVAQGLTNKEIALSLHLCRTTVATHLRRIFRKLDITTRASLAGMAPMLLPNPV